MIEVWKSDLFKMFSPENCPDTLFQLQMCPKICPNGAGYIVSEVLNYSVVYVTGSSFQCSNLGVQFIIKGSLYGGIYRMKNQYMYKNV